MPIERSGVTTILSLSSNSSDNKFACEREYKGISLLENMADYTAIDLETTGIDPHWDSIIEIAAIRVRDNVVVERFQSLVNPECEIDEFITELTGITNEMVSDAPILRDILPQYVEFIGADVVVAHNANFDINFIYDNCITMFGTGFPNNFIDIMRVSRRLFKEHSHHRLVDIIERFGMTSDIGHRALPDTMMVCDCYEYMKKHAVDSGIELNSLYPPKYHDLKAKTITTTNTEFDESCPLYGKLFVFTGVLNKMARKEAMQLVVDAGGTCGDSVTKRTNYLVLGNNDYCASIKDGKSSKQKKAEKLMLSGADLQIISEDVFYDMLAEKESYKG